jgi:hypothetical protein
MLLTLTAVHNWHTKQTEFVPPALYMKVPAGIEVENGANAKDYVLRIHRNIYGQKQAGRVWNKYLSEKLIKDLGFKQSRVD